MKVTAEIRFAIIPEWVLDSGITGTAIHLYCVLARYANDDGHCHPSQKRIASRMGCSPNTVVRAMKELEGIEAVVITPQFGPDGSPAANDYLLRVSPPSPQK
jgi:DNA-binding MarR family transcriptional regulator